MNESGSGVHACEDRHSRVSRLAVFANQFFDSAWSVVVLLAVHALMLTWIAIWNSPVCDEVGHLTAGAYCWKSGKFFLYRVNPPLVKQIAALPTVLGSPEYDWSDIAEGAADRPEFSIGQAFIRINGLGAFWYFTAGRLMCLPFTVLGGGMCFLWGRTLYGHRSGVIACLLWCFSPTVLGWGSVFTPDAAAASMGLLAVYAFRNWIESPTWSAAFQTGAALGLCLLTKTSWVLLLVLWPIQFCLWRHVSTKIGGSRPPFRHLALVIGLAVYVINIGYGFEGMMKPLGDFEFCSRSLTGLGETGAIGNRFRNTWLTALPVPFPENYVRGIDLQKVDFERGMESYLCGTWSDRGWWYYYIVACVFKAPTGILVLFTLALWARVIGSGDISLRRRENLLFVPALCLFVLVSSQDGFGRYIRYVLPAFPAAYCLISGLWSVPVSGWFRLLRSVCVIWFVVSSLSIYPHSMSYFNELAGGPLNGWRYLLDANIDWGQDLIRLRHWLEHQPHAKPVYVVHTGFVSANDVGIDSAWPPRLPDAHPHHVDRPVFPSTTTESDLRAGALPAGTYVISVNELFHRHGQYRYLLERTPVDRIGYSMWVYRIE